MNNVVKFTMLLTNKEITIQIFLIKKCDKEYSQTTKVLY
jgi:hypothetical protein